MHAVRLAGRETRLGEPFANDIYQIADEIVTALLPIIRDKAFAFFGHSFGSYIALITALLLKEKYKMEPMHIFVSGASAPHVSSVFLGCLRDEEEGSGVPVIGLGSPFVWPGRRVWIL